MKRNRWILTLVVSFVTLVASAAPNSLYFMDILPYRTYQNPALRPMSDTYVEIPGLSTISASMGTGNLSLNDFIYVKDGKLVTFLHPEYGNKDALFAKLGSTCRFSTDVDVSVLGFGFKVKEKGYFSFNASARIDALVGLPKDLFALAFYGTPDTVNVNKYDLSSLAVSARSYVDFGFGYMHQINEKWSVGGRLHLLVGAFAADMYSDKAYLEASAQQWTIEGNSNLLLSVPGLGVEVDENGSITGFTSSDFMSMLSCYRPSMGAAIDLGLEYKPLPELSISVSLKDIGFMYWNNVVAAQSSVNGSYEGFYFGDQQINFVDSLAASFGASMLYDPQKTHYVQEMRGKLYVGAEYSFLRNMMSVGLLSKTEFMSNYVSEEVSLNYKIRPCHWFGISAGYSFVSGGWSTLGFGLDLKLPPFNFYVATDYTPLYYSAEGIPYRSSAINVQAGIVLTFKTKDNVKKLTAKKAKELAEVPVVAEQTPVITEDLPVVEETPVMTEGVPAVEEAPVMTEDVPAVAEEVPAMTEGAPVVTEENAEVKNAETIE